MLLQLLNVSSTRYPNASDLSGWGMPLGLLTIATRRISSLAPSSYGFAR